MRSMTGYGKGTASALDGRFRINVEITSINRKNLDLNLSAPREWSGFEQKCMAWLRPAFHRGRVNIQVRLESAEDSDGMPDLDTDAMDRKLKDLRVFAGKRNLPFNVDADFLLALAESVQHQTSAPDWREMDSALHEAFEQALAELDAMRLDEGRALAGDLAARLGKLGELRAGIQNSAENAPRAHRDLLLERIRQLGLDLDPDDDRVLKEIALFADRCDVSEELTRLVSHFEQFRKFLESSEAVGRKLDFLCQEIHRELNTVGGKSTRAEITRAIIESKNELERIREQVQNIE